LHTKEQAKFDYETFVDKLSHNAIIMFHDSIKMKWSKKIYGPGREYQTDVKMFIDELKTDPNLQIFDLPFAEGLTLARRI
jgi:predicted O-methyltransferase YrrM